MTGFFFWNILTKGIVYFISRKVGHSASMVDVVKARIRVQCPFLTQMFDWNYHYDVVL